MSPKPKDPVERYLAKVDRRGPDECWPWTAACFEKGYGAFRLGDKQLKAHRFGFQTFVGPIPDGHIICHTCDNPPCQNPGHWFSGTTRDNAIDRKTKGRGATGTRNGGWTTARHTAEDVRNMRLLGLQGVTQAEIARRYDTHQSDVSAILLRKTWKHADTDLPAWTSSRHYKVTEDIVDAVLAEYVPRVVRMDDLAEKHGISRRSVRMILDGWRPKRITSH